MSILDGIIDKAKELLVISEPYAIRDTRTYDSSKNRIIVAGITLDGVVSSVISTDTLTKQENGIDHSYTAISKQIEPKTLTVTILPTAQCLLKLVSLSLKQEQINGWFNISVHENDVIVNVYRAWVLSLPEIGMQQEGSDRVVVFGIKSMVSGVSSINQSTQTENDVYSLYGSNPDLAGANSSSTIDESTGIITTPYKNAEGTGLKDAPVIDLTQE